MSAMLTAALQYAAEGLRVFPLQTRGKRPRIKRWQEEATADPDRIREWWGRWPEANIGIVAGDGLAVVDVDTGGQSVREALVRLLGEERLPATRIVRTGSGGIHLYFRDDPDAPLPQTAGALGDGVDTRAAGRGYVVAPPSLHPSGEPYRVLRDHALAPVPGWIRDRIGVAAQNGVRSDGDGGEGAYLQEGQRNAALASLAGSMRARGMSPDAILAALLAENDARCSPPLPDHEVRTIARSVSRYEPHPQLTVVGPRAEDEFEADPNATPPAHAPGPAARGPVRYTDEDAVARILPRLRDRLRYAGGQRGQWYVWDAYRWARDEGLRHDLVIRAELARLALAIMERAAAAPSKGEAKPLEQWATRLQSADGVSAVTRLLRAKVGCVPADFDQDPYLLNTPAGPVDLRTGELRRADPAGMHSRAAAVAPQPGGMPLFRSFLDHLTGGDPELQRFIQKMLGYALTGDTSEKSLWFIWGANTDTGKSTFLNLVAELMGTYADRVDADVLIGSRRNSIPAELARLPGVRFVSATEPEAGHAWNEKRIKSITGGDPIEVRFLYGQPFTYTPQYKIVIVGNSEPVIRNVDAAMLRRIHIVPFDIPVPRSRQVPNLARRMAEEEGPAILYWMLEGCRLWLEEGLEPPEAVARQTRRYIEDEDTLGQWIREECETGEGCEAPRQDLYRAWAEWCRMRGEEPGGAKAFKRKLDARRRDLGLQEAIVEADGRRLRGYRGIRLRETAEFGVEI